MSQFYVTSTSGGSVIPPDILTVFETDLGEVVPATNIVLFNGRDTNINNDNGIRVIASPDGSNQMYVELTNRITGSITTTNATPTVLVSVPLGATPGTYIAWGDLSCFTTTGPAGGAYTFEGAAITNGVSGTELGSEVRNIFESAPLATADFTFSVIGNNAVVTVQGIVGVTINWSCLFYYRFQG